MIVIHRWNDTLMILALIASTIVIMVNAPCFRFSTCCDAGGGVPKLLPHEEITKKHCPFVMIIGPFIVNL